MSDQNQPDSPSGEAPSQGEPETQTEDDLAEQGDPLAAAQEEIARLNERTLRLAAELENTRRRAEREKADAGRYAIGAFARDLIGVADNFERAFRVFETGGETAEAVAGLVDGLRMTEKELLSVLARHGVQRVAAEREKFDPNLHQAVAQVPHADIRAGHVVDVAQQGFTIGERVLRAAMVTVSSGPGENAQRPEEPAGNEQIQNEPGGRLDTKV